MDLEDITNNIIKNEEINTYKNIIKSITDELNLYKKNYLEKEEELKKLKSNLKNFIET